MDEVSRGASELRCLVDLGARFHEEADVGYVDSNLKYILLNLLDGERIIEIFGCDGVNGEYSFLSQVKPFRQLIFGDRPLTSLWVKATDVRLQTLQYWA